MEKETEKNEKLDFAKYVGLYLSRFQQSQNLYKPSEGGPGIDIFRPFKYVWFILANIWSEIFRKRG